MNSFSQNPNVPAAQKDRSFAPGVRVHFFCFWLSVNSQFSLSPVNGYSEGRWPLANVGVHSYIITIRGQFYFKRVSSVFCGFVTLYEFVVQGSTTGVDKFKLTPQMTFLSRRHSSQWVNPSSSLPLKKKSALSFMIPYKFMALLWFKLQPNGYIIIIVFCELFCVFIPRIKPSKRLPPGSTKCMLEQEVRFVYFNFCLSI